MIILLRRVLILILSVWLSASAAPVQPVKEPSVSAASAIVMDAATGTVLYRKNQDEPCAVASTTKIMTCLLACESGKLSDTVTVDGEMLQGTEGSSANLKRGDTVTLFDLVKGAMLASGNDAANAIACYLSGSTEAFAVQMNRRAAELGMQNTCFVTPSGLDKGDHHSTAYDMALLTAAALDNEQLAAVASESADSITVSGTKVNLQNHNKLLQQDSAFSGFKTGYTKKAGRCLVSTYRYENSTIICVTLHSPDDWNDHTKLVAYAKSKYRQLTDKVTLSLPAVGGRANSIMCEYQYDISVCCDVTVKEYYYPFVYAPAYCGDTVGYVELTDDSNTLLQRVPLRVQNTIE